MRAALAALRAVTRNPRVAPSSSPVSLRHASSDADPPPTPHHPRTPTSSTTRIPAPPQPPAPPGPRHTHPPRYAPKPPGFDRGRARPAWMPTDDALFAEQNVAHLDNRTLARMVEVHRMVKSHAKAADAGRAPDDGRNALFSENDMPVDSLIRVPDAVLREFRKRFPADRIANLDAVGNVQQAEAQIKTHTTGAQPLSGWKAVDEMTMDPGSVQRRRRFAERGNALGISEDAAETIRRERMRGRNVRYMRCPLSNSRGRVDVDFRQVDRLREFLSVTGKILPRRRTSCTTKAQRRLRRAIKTARQMALLNPTDLLAASSL